MHQWHRIIFSVAQHTLFQLFILYFSIPGPSTAWKRHIQKNLYLLGHFHGFDQLLFEIENWTWITESFQDINPPFWPSQRVSKHTLMKPSPSLPALFLQTMKKMPPQPASLYTTLMIHDFLYENLNFLYENLNFLHVNLNFLHKNLRFSTWKIL